MIGAFPPACQCSRGAERLQMSHQALKGQMHSRIHKSLCTCVHASRPRLRLHGTLFDGMWLSCLIWPLFPEIARKVVFWRTVPLMLCKYMSMLSGTQTQAFVGCLALASLSRLIQCVGALISLHAVAHQDISCSIDLSSQH